MRRYVVGEHDPRTLGAVLARAGADERAIADGRVFVGKRRAKRADEAVTPGDEIAWSDAAPQAASIALLFADDALVVADKPAGLATIPDHAGARGSLLHLAAQAAGLDAASLHATSRLDRDVSGVVVFARTQEAARALQAARDEGTYVRRYVALAARAPTAERGVWDAPIGRAKDARHRAVGGRDATEARTRYAVVARAGEVALLALAPETGRTHQLRVHASHAGAPLLGDRTYGGPTRLTLGSGRTIALGRVALHCARVRVPRARGGQTLDLASPVPRELVDWWLALGGEPSAWDTGIRCEL